MILVWDVYLLIIDHFILFLLILFKSIKVVDISSDDFDNRRFLFHIIKYEDLLAFLSLYFDKQIN